MVSTLHVVQRFTFMEQIAIYIYNPYYISKTKFVDGQGDHVVVCTYFFFLKFINEWNLFLNFFVLIIFF